MLDPEERRRHLYIVGQTGTGKSTLLLNLIAQDLAAGAGLALLDPHGDLAEAVLLHVPRDRTNDLVYLNPADAERPIGFNPLSGVPEDLKPIVADGVVSAFRHVWPESWGPRLDYILTNAVRALLDVPGATLLMLPRLLIDEGFRVQLVEHHVGDPMVRSFWLNEYAGPPPPDPPKPEKSAAPGASPGPEAAISFQGGGALLGARCDETRAGWCGAARPPPPGAPSPSAITHLCQSARKWDPDSAANWNPYQRLRRSSPESMEGTRARRAVPSRATERRAWGGAVGPRGRSAGLGTAGQARFLKRQLSLPVSRMSQWWVRRSSSAVVILASPKTLGHSAKARLVDRMIEVRS